MGRRRTGHASSRGDRRFAVATAIAFAATLAVFLATMAPTIYALDSAELTTAAYTGGLVRATGYPTYLLIGRVWSRLPVGEVGWRMNLMSAVFGALTVVLIMRVLRRLGVGPIASLGAVGLFAVSRYFWGLSLIAEVYTLHTAFTAAILLSLLRWQERPDPRRLALATFLTGLGFGNHVATVLLAPGLVWFVLRSVGPRSLLWRPLLAAAAGLIAGLSVYLYLPLVYLSHPAFNYVGHFDGTGSFVAVDLTTARGMWWLVSGRAFAGQMLAYTPAELVEEAGRFLADLWATFVAVGIGPGLLGAAVLWQRDRRIGVALPLIFAATVAFYIDYRVVDKSTMFLPAYLVWTVWLGVGYQWLLDWIAEARKGPTRDTGSLPRQLVAAAMIAAVGFGLLWNGPRVDLSDDWSARERGEAAIAAIDPGGLLVGWWATVPLVEYLQMVEGRRRDIDVINRFLISAGDLDQLLRLEVGRRPVYLDEPPGDGFPWLAGVATGPLVRLHFSAPSAVGSQIVRRNGVDQ